MFFVPFEATLEQMLRRTKHHDVLNLFSLGVILGLEGQFRPEGLLLTHVLGPQRPLHNVLCAKRPARMAAGAA